MTSDDFQSFKTKLTSTLLQHRQESEQKKRQKFLRDAEDYRNNRVYRWKDSFSTGSYRPRRIPSDSTYSSSDNERFSNRRTGKKDNHQEEDKEGRTMGKERPPRQSRRDLRTLSPPQMSLLQKGLSFCPSYKLDTFQLDMDLQKFYRSLRLKVFFNKTDDTNTPISSSVIPSSVNLQRLGIKTKSNFMPPKNDHPVETFIELIDREVDLFKQDVSRGKLYCPVNMTNLEQQALDSLIKDKELVVKPADKGGAIVIMDQRDYLAEIHRQLADRTIYEPLSHNPTSSIATKILNTIEPYLLNNTIDKKVYDFLMNQFPITPVFYVHPKVHKRLDKPPGRPIVASTDSVLSPLSILLEKILTPMVRLTKSFIIDTGDFIKLIKDIGQVPCDSILVTWDVNSLYTSIIHDKGLAAVQELLNGSSLDDNTIRFCMELLNLVLREKFFMFGDEFFLQKQGTAMGSNVAPPYANCFMAFFEKHFVYTNKFFQDYATIWRRYIDDIFCIWRGPLDSLFSFTSTLIKFGLNFSSRYTMILIQSVFLDTRIIKLSDGTLEIDLHVKATDRNSLLLFSSCHPRATRESLPLSQFNRISRIVLNPVVREIRLDETQKNSLRGAIPIDYSIKCVHTREQTSTASSVGTPFVFSFYVLHKNIRKHWRLPQDSGVVLNTVDT
ncbi:unnamed protein product [Ranitomeya imitator]|uniref:Reverse transcriptase domain-containing protein n=1 Tax=Ranitomeya imitator TaxID=111125 RepID=A0ABN9L2D4_9NEOB|nr:unnamed protein product [Ranitomeya imitator]